MFGAMHDQPHPRAVHVQARADGALLYLVALPPEALPPVRARDLAAAWDAARNAAWTNAGARCGCSASAAPRTPRSTSRSAMPTPAAGPARSMPRSVSVIRTALSLCLRLLALVDLLAHAPWASDLVALRRDGAAIQPPLLAAAAERR